MGDPVGLTTLTDIVVMKRFQAVFEIDTVLARLISWTPRPVNDSHGDRKGYLAAAITCVCVLLQVMVLNCYELCIPNL